MSGVLKLNWSSHFKVKCTGSHLTNEKTEGGSTTLSSQSSQLPSLKLGGVGGLPPPPFSPLCFEVVTFHVSPYAVLQ